MKIRACINSKNRKSWWIVLFLAGVLLAQLLGSTYLTETLLGADHLTNFAGQPLDPEELFFPILWKRGKLFFLIFLLCLTSFRRVVSKCLPVILLFVLGFYAGLCLACQGILGIGICFLSVFPHGVIYIFVLYLILHMKKPIQYSGKRYILTEFVSVLFVLLLFVAGCLLEATVGSFLLKHYLLAFISAIS